MCPDYTHFIRQMQAMPLGQIIPGCSYDLLRLSLAGGGSLNEKLSNIGIGFAYSLKMFKRNLIRCKFSVWYEVEFAQGKLLNPRLLALSRDQKQGPIAKIV